MYWQLTKKEETKKLRQITNRKMLAKTKGRTFRDKQGQARRAAKQGQARRAATEDQVDNDRGR